jgi:hypothetical protein
MIPLRFKCNPKETPESVANNKCKAKLVCSFVNYVILRTKMHYLGQVEKTFSEQEAEEIKVDIDCLFKKIV